MKAANATWQEHVEWAERRALDKITRYLADDRYDEAELALQRHIANKSRWIDGTHPKLAACKPPLHPAVRD